VGFFHVGKRATKMAHKTDQQLDDDDQEKDPSVHSFTLSTGCSWPNAVKWSFDGRIAILTDTVIHILVSFRLCFIFYVLFVFFCC